MSLLQKCKGLFLRKEGTLLKNTAMLYLLTFSTYLFNLITVPYQTRVLGPILYGTMGFAMSFATYVRLILDFGFLLSATEDVARSREDRGQLSRIFSSVTACKLLLGLVTLAGATGICLAVPAFRENFLLLELFFLWTFIDSLLPDYLYRGMETMEKITLRTVAVKAFFTVMVFVFLKSPEQYLVIPVLNIIGSLGAVIWVYADVKKSFHIGFLRVSLQEVLHALQRSAGYFVSRIASTVYGATNTFVLGVFFPGSTHLGFYTSADKLVTTARSAVSPISDSLYPHMVKNRDFKLVKKVLLLFMPIITLGCTLVGIFARPFCIWFFGEDFADADAVLQLLMPVIIITLPTYICGFPLLTPMGLSRFANISTVVGAAVHIVMLALLFAFRVLTVKAVCIATCITEATVLAFRIAVIVKNRHLMKGDPAK